MVHEQWAPVVGAEKDYAVSSFGRVKRISAAQGTQTGRILKPVVLKARGGYLTVKIHRQARRVHRLVAEAFLGVNTELLVRHLDGDPTNNKITNLAYGTDRDNAADRTRHGRSSIGKSVLRATCRNGHAYLAGTFRMTEYKRGSHRVCIVCEKARS